jgi:hypothetical protein
MKAMIDKQSVTVNFSPTRKLSNPAFLNIAYPDFDQSSNIIRDENTGRKLNHDFVVMTWQQHPLSTTDTNYH